MVYFQTDYYCGSGLGTDQSAADGMSDGTDLGMPVICKKTYFYAGLH